VLRSQGSRSYWGVNTNVNTAIWRILVTASSNRRERQSILTQLRFAQTTDQKTKIRVIQLANVVARYFEHC